MDVLVELGLQASVHRIFDDAQPVRLLAVQSADEGDDLRKIKQVAEAPCYASRGEADTQRELRPDHIYGPDGAVGTQAGVGGEWGRPTGGRLMTTALMSSNWAASCVKARTAP